MRTLKKSVRIQLIIKNHEKALKISQGTTLAEHSKNRNNVLLAAVEITAVQINTKKTQGRKSQ